MKYIISRVLAGTVLMISASFALADDFSPPPWDRNTQNNNPFAVMYGWEFGSMSGQNPSGGMEPQSMWPGSPMFTGEAVGAKSSDVQWTPDGWKFNYSGAISFTIPDVVDEEPVKFVRVQVTTHNANPSLLEIGARGATDNGAPVTDFTDVIKNGGGNKFLFSWEIRPNPDWETFDLVGGTDDIIKQVVVDTLSTIPEPTALALAGLGIASLLVLRRKN
jgi:hypothetical protein